MCAGLMKLLSLFPTVWLISVHPSQQATLLQDSPSLKRCYYCLTACLQSYCRLYWVVTQSRAMWRFFNSFPEWLIWLRSVMVCTVTASTVELCWFLFKDLLLWENVDKPGSCCFYAVSLSIYVAVLLCNMFCFAVFFFFSTGIMDQVHQYSSLNTLLLDSF